MKLLGLRRRAKSAGHAPATPVLREADVLPTGLFVLGDTGSRFPTMSHRTPSESSPNTSPIIPRLIVDEPPPLPSPRRGVNRERPFATLSTVIVRNASAPIPTHYVNHHLRQPDSPPLTLPDDSRIEASPSPIDLDAPNGAIPLSQSPDSSAPPGPQLRKMSSLPSQSLRSAKPQNTVGHGGSPKRRQTGPSGVDYTRSPLSAPSHTISQPESQETPLKLPPTAVHIDQPALLPPPSPSPKSLAGIVQTLRRASTRLRDITPLKQMTADRTKSQSVQPTPATPVRVINNSLHAGRNGDVMVSPTAPRERPPESPKLQGYKNSGSRSPQSIRRPRDQIPPSPRKEAYPTRAPEDVFVERARTLDAKAIPSSQIHPNGNKVLRANTEPLASGPRSYYQQARSDRPQQSHTPSPKRNALVLDQPPINAVGPGNQEGSGNLTDAIASAFLMGSLDDAEDSDEDENMADDERIRPPRRTALAPVQPRNANLTPPGNRSPTIASTHSPGLQGRSKSTTHRAQSPRAERNGGRDQAGSPRLLRI